MNLQELTDGLTALGFTTGYAAKDGDPAEVILWENEAKQPTTAALLKAAPQGAYLRELATVSDQRRVAYTLESDPLAFKYQETELPEDKAIWLAKKAEIQARYPEPEAPVK